MGEDFADNVELRHKLRAPFPKEQIGHLPKPTRRGAQKGHCNECGGYHGLPAIHLPYVGHAAVTDRLNTVEPGWTFTIDRVIEDGGHVQGVIGTMTIGGKSIPETGDGEPREDSFWADDMKRAISDFIRRGAMRFGVAIDLWSREDLTSTGTAAGAPPVDAGASPQTAPAIVSGEEAKGMGKAPDASSSLTDQAVALYGTESRVLRAASMLHEVTTFEAIPEETLETLIQKKKQAS